jgi:phage-related protein
MKLSIHFYQTSGGTSPVGQYLESLEEAEAAPLYAALADIQRHGIKGALVESRPLRGKLWELKIGRYRLFYVLITGPVMVLLHASKKQSQKARLKVLNLALSRMREVLDAV